MITKRVQMFSFKFSQKFNMRTTTARTLFTSDNFDKSAESLRTFKETLLAFECL
jgi:hypothetical protein